DERQADAEDRIADYLADRTDGREREDVARVQRGGRGGLLVDHFPLLPGGEQDVLDAVDQTHRSLLADGKRVVGGCTYTAAQRRARKEAGRSVGAPRVRASKPPHLR